MKRMPTPWIVVFLIMTGAFAVSPRVQGSQSGTSAEVRPNPAFVAPASSTVTGRTLLVVAQTEPHFDSINLTRVAFEFSSDTGRNWQPIRIVSGLDDGGDSFDPNRWEALWDTSFLPAGFYILRVTMTYPVDGTLRRRYRCRGIRVNKSPIIRSIRVTPDFEPGYVRFDGRDVADPDGKVRSWAWDFGDPMANEQAEFWDQGRRAITYFPEPDRCYSVRLSITDDNQAQTEAYYQLCPAESGLMISAETSCACKSLKVRTKGEAFGPDGEQDGMGWPAKAGKYDGKKLGPLDGNFGNPAMNNEKVWTSFAFEVVAEVTGNPALCKETQLVKATFKNTDGTESNAKFNGMADRDLDGTIDLDATTKDKCESEDSGGHWNNTKMVCEFPQNGEKYGPDAGSSSTGSMYDAPYTYKAHQGFRVLWLDFPGFSGSPNGKILNADFIAILRGTDAKYCYAKFHVDLEKKAGVDKEMISADPQPNADGDIIGKVGEASVPGVP